MPLPVTTNQTNAIDAAVVRTAYFVEFQFRDGTQYLSTLNIPVTWGGNTWSGLGTIGTISAISESESLNATSVNFTINAAQPSWLALATGDVQEYRGLPAKMFFCPLDSGFNLIDTPVQCWAGVMDMVTIGITGDQAGITLKCETSAYGLKRANSYRMNAAQQKQTYPTDTGFDYQENLITNPAVWLTVAFMASVGPYANA
jgi:hypothetical protein